VAEFKQAGDQAGLEAWGVFGRGWSWSRISVQNERMQETTLTAFPADWTAATKQLVTGEVVFAPCGIRRTAKQAIWKDRAPDRSTKIPRLGGKIVMIDLPVLFHLPEKSRTVPPR
jgi:hypothetical protein